MEERLKRMCGKVKEVKAYQNPFGQYCVSLKYKDRIITLISNDKIGAVESDIIYANTP